MKAAFAEATGKSRGSPISAGASHDETQQQTPEAEHEVRERKLERAR